MLLCVTGHRPEKIGGYDPLNPLRRAIRAEIEKRLQLHRPEAAITGMAIGVDQDFALVCLSLGIPFWAAVPFGGQEKRWPPDAQRAYHELLARASWTTIVSPGGYTARKMQVRNEWMVDRVGSDGIVLAVYDGTPGGTANCYAYAERRGRKIDRINPADLVAGAA